MNTPALSPDELSSSTVAVPGLRSSLVREHMALDGCFDRLVAASRANAREDVAAAWADLDRLLSDHLAFEELVIFPELRPVDLHEIDALLHEHQKIRALMTEMGVEVDLHVVRLARVHELVELLRKHAAREDAVLYRWAELSLPGQARARALQRVHAQH